MRIQAGVLVVDSVHLSCGVCSAIFELPPVGVVFARDASAQHHGNSAAPARHRSKRVVAAAVFSPGGWLDSPHHLLRGADATESIRELGVDSTGYAEPPDTRTRAGP